jgi:hypothetical protein
MIEKKEDGSVLVTFPKLSKVQVAFGIYWDWLHVANLENTYHSEYSKNSLTKIKNIVREMSQDEKLEFRKMATLLPPYIFNPNESISDVQNVYDADIIAISVYLQQGHSPSDAISAFLNVFENKHKFKKRLEILKNFIDKIDKKQQK